MKSETIENTPQQDALDANATEPDAASSTSVDAVTDEDISQRVAVAVAAADDRQALDLKVLELAGVSDFTDYFLICSGANERQVQAIAGAVDATLRERKVRPLHQEGANGGNWVLLDYGDFIVHVFRDEIRRFYALERLWGDAPEVTDRFRT